MPFLPAGRTRAGTCIPLHTPSQAPCDGVSGIFGEVRLDGRERMSRRWLFPWQWDIVQDGGPHPHVYTTCARPGRPALCFDGCDNADSPVRGASRTARSLVMSPAARLILNTEARCPAGRPPTPGWEGPAEWCGWGLVEFGSAGSSPSLSRKPRRKGSGRTREGTPSPEQAGWRAALSALQCVSGEHPSRGMSPALV